MPILVISCPQGMRTRAKWVRRALVAGSLASSGGAFAQGDSPQAQFDYGLAEMLAGRYATGCPALAASEKSDPHPGTLFTLGECELRWKHSASALRRLVEYLDLVTNMPTAGERDRQSDRVKVATAQRQQLEKQVARITLVVPAGSPDDAEVRVDGVPVPRRWLGEPLPLDPGDHVIGLSVGDGRKSEQRVTLAAGDERRIALAVPPARAQTSSAVSTQAPLAPHAAGQPAASAEPPESHAPPSSRRRWIWMAGGAGAAGVVVGGVAGLLALVENASASRSCGTDGLSPGQCTSQQGVDAGKAARTWAMVSTVAFSFGAVGLATSAVLWLTAPSHDAGMSTSCRWRPVVGLTPQGGWVGAGRAW